MKLIDKLTLRLYFFLCLLLCNIRVWAQEDDDSYDGRSRGSDVTDVFDAGEMADYQTMHFSASDIILIVLLIVACYFFGKIWKGCTYLLLVFAALLYYLSR
jgi:hypothetical protein